MDEYRPVTGLMANFDRMFLSIYQMQSDMNKTMEKMNMNKQEKIEFRVEMGLTGDEQTLLALADDMAAAMSNLNSQNYKEFIDARDRFRGVISEMVARTRKNEERIARMKEAILAA